MKLESARIQNFRHFDDIEISFKNRTLQEATNQFLVLGDNGAGKTTLLQAITLPLAFVSKQIQSVSDFYWSGFLSDRFWLGGIPRIELQISFQEEEIEATRLIAQRWYDSQPIEFRPEKFVEPGDSRLLTVTLNGEYWKVGDKNSIEERSQFQGRYYAQRLLKRDPTVRAEFSKLPGFFWFDQFRNLGYDSNFENAGEKSLDNSSSVSFDFGVEKLRKYLIAWNERERSGHGDSSENYLSQLQNLYTRIFPGRSFHGVEYLPSNDSPSEMNTYFTLHDGQKTYDIAEMSAGEQSVFPMLYEIVRQKIAYSIVLIDEVDLNLHPPVAQLLVNQLSKISPTCQFILTTHSESVSDLIGEDETFRLPGGSLCL